MPEAVDRAVDKVTDAELETLSLCDELEKGLDALKLELAVAEAL